MWSRTAVRHRNETGQAVQGKPARRAPFAQVEKPTISDARLTHTAFRLLTWLLAQAKGGDVALASVAQMRKAIGCRSKRTIQAAIKLLASYRYLTIVPRPDLAVGRVFRIDTAASLAADDAAAIVGMDPAELERVPTSPGMLQVMPRLDPATTRKPSPAPRPVDPERVQAWVDSHTEPTPSVAPPPVQEIAPPPATSCTQIVQIPEREIPKTKKPRKSPPRYTNDLKPFTKDDAARTKALCEMVDRIKGVDRRTPQDDIPVIAAAMARMMGDAHSIPNWRKWLRMQADGNLPSGVIGEAFRDVMAQVAKGTVARPGGYLETTIQSRLAQRVQVQRDRLEAHREQLAAAETPRIAQEPVRTPVGDVGGGMAQETPPATTAASTPPSRGVAARVAEQLNRLRGPMVEPTAEELADAERRKSEVLAKLKASRERHKPTAQADGEAVAS
jgi:hypothetical protein